MNDVTNPVNPTAENSDEANVEVAVEATVTEGSTEAPQEPVVEPSEENSSESVVEGPQEDLVESQNDEQTEVEKAPSSIDLSGLTRPEAEDAVRKVIQAAGIPYNSVLYASGVITVECLGKKPAKPLVQALGLDLLGEPVHVGIVPGTVGRTVFKFEA